MQELQKQVETISLVAETPDEEELEDEEEEEGVYWKSLVLQMCLYFHYINPKICINCSLSRNVEKNTPYCHVHIVVYLNALML